MSMRHYFISFSHSYWKNVPIAQNPRMRWLLIQFQGYGHASIRVAVCKPVRLLWSLKMETAFLCVSGHNRYVPNTTAPWTGGQGRMVWVWARDSAAGAVVTAGRLARTLRGRTGSSPALDDAFPVVARTTEPKNKNKI